MTAIDRTQTVATLVLEHPECAKVFQDHRIDFCCKGNMSVPDACRERGVDEGQLWRELEDVVARRGGAPFEDFRSMTVPALVAYIIVNHHAYLREAMPFIGQMAAKVARVHGEHNPKLVELDAAYRRLAEIILPHLDDEETELFPALAAKQQDPAAVRRGLSEMSAEHREVGALLERIRSAADDFTVPDWGCTTYRTLFSELRTLEGDILRHVHLENHVLAPRFLS